MKIEGDQYLKAGEKFEFMGKSPGTAAAATFCVIDSDRVYVTRYAKFLWQFPDETPVVAHWHGQYATDGFATTIGELREKAKAKGWDCSPPHRTQVA